MNRNQQERSKDFINSQSLIPAPYTPNEHDKQNTQHDHLETENPFYSSGNHMHKGYNQAYSPFLAQLSAQYETIQTVRAERSERRKNALHTYQTNTHQRIIYGSEAMGTLQNIKA